MKELEFLESELDTIEDDIRNIPDIVDSITYEIDCFTESRYGMKSVNDFIIKAHNEFAKYEILIKACSYVAVTMAELEKPE